MQGIVLDIFRGCFESLERLYGKDSGHAFDEMEALQQFMKRRIPEEFHSLLEKYEKAMMKVLDEACELDFMAGYQLGVRMMIDAWPSA